MKITCLKEYIQKAAILSEKISGKNPTLPVLNAVLITVGKKKIIFSSTNLEMALEITIPGKIEEEGSVAVPSKIFSSFVSSLFGQENIIIKSIKDNLLLSTKNSSTTIKGYNVDDFPVLPKIDKKNFFTIDVGDFLSGLKSVYYSVSLSEMKPEINSVCIFSTSKTSLTFVATDSFRLAEKTIPYNFSNMPTVMIPFRSVIEILRIFDNQNGDLIVEFNDNNLVLVCGYIKFTSRLIDGLFPDYKSIIPTRFSVKAIVDRKIFFDSLKTASMFCNKLNEVRIKIYNNDNYLELQTDNQELGEHATTMKCEIEGEDFFAVFNYRYIMDCLSSINSDKLLFRFSGENKPMIVSGFDDNSFCYLVMPMKNT